jgi:hypothetical protein
VRPWPDGGGDAWPGGGGGDARPGGGGAVSAWGFGLKTTKETGKNGEEEKWGYKNLNLEPLRIWLKEFEFKKGLNFLNQTFE